MLIYSKKNTEGKVALFGTVGSIPNLKSVAEGGDYELVYKDGDGDILTLTAGDVYVDATASGIQQVKRLSDNKPLTVYIKTLVEGHETLTKVIGTNPVTPKVVSSIKIATPATKLVFTVGETFDRTGLVVNKVYADGDKIQATAGEISTDYDAKVFATGDIGTDKKVTITCAGKTVKYSITVNAA